MMKLFNAHNLAYCDIEGTLIFLDIAKDRYFRLSAEQNSDTLALIDRCGLCRDYQPQCLPRAKEWSTPLRASDAISNGSFQISEIARGMWVQRRIERRLERGGFKSILLDLCRISNNRSALNPVTSVAAVRTIRGFEHARLLRTAADRCLPRSLALAFCLAARNVRTHVVIGVKLAPFGAHCWVQGGDEVLNDSVEEVLRFKPILVI